MLTLQQNITLHHSLPSFYINLLLFWVTWQQRAHNSLFKTSLEHSGCSPCLSDISQVSATRAKDVHWKLWGPAGRLGAPAKLDPCQRRRHSGKHAACWGLRQTKYSVAAFGTRHLSNSLSDMIDEMRHNVQPEGDRQLCWFQWKCFFFSSNSFKFYRQSNLPLWLYYCQARQCFKANKQQKEKSQFHALNRLKHPINTINYEWLLAP